MCFRIAENIAVQTVCEGEWDRMKLFEARGMCGKLRKGSDDVPGVFRPARQKLRFAVGNIRRQN